MGYVEDNGLSKLADGSLVVESSAVRRQKRLSGHDSKPNERDHRTESEKDRGRVSYSPFLRRLAGVTQVVSPNLRSSHLHTRESHSQKVALVAREIAEDIVRRADSEKGLAETIAAFGGLNITACETAGLAHDLGHPPFGHAGEVVLNRVLRGKGVVDGFEGNAQSFRIVTKLDRRKLSDVNGLDLTNVTLAAILKYPRLCPNEWLVNNKHSSEASEKPPKFGAYTSEANLFEGVMASAIHPEGGRDRQTLEASVMDLADDITYAIHDLEDFYKEGIIDFVQVDNDIDEALEFLKKQSIDDVSQNEPNAFLVFGKEVAHSAGSFFHTELYTGKLYETKMMITKGGLKQRYTGTQVQLAQALSTFSLTIEELLGDVRVTTEPPWENGPSVYLGREGWHLIQCLKTVTRRYVVATSSMGIVERSQQKMVEKLFGNLAKWVESSPRLRELPQPLSGYLRDVDPEGLRVSKHVTPAHYRAISDYICSLSDEGCSSRSQWLRGSEVPILSTAR